MVTRGVVFVVFLLPVIFSIIFGTLVMAEVLKEPERELKMWQFKSSGTQIVSSEAIKILKIQKQYSTTTPIEIEVTIDDPVFDCGDLYITIFDVGSTSKEVVSQSGFFDQCFERNNSRLPIDDEFSEIIDTPGKYEIMIEINDKNQKKNIASSAKFTVK